MIGFEVDRRRMKKKVQLKHVLLLGAILIVLIIRFSHNAFGSHALWINEVMASNKGTFADEDGDFPDWIEIHNSGTSAIDLEGFWLSNDPTNPLKWKFPDITLTPQGYLLVFASGKDRSDPEGVYLHSNFKLNAADAAVVLSTPDIRVVDNIQTGALLFNVSLGRVPGKRNEWAFYLDSTPGSQNLGEGLITLHIGPAEDKSVYVNEFMTMNNTTLVDSDGDRPDWIELHNRGSTPRNLEGYWLSDEGDNPLKWRFPPVVIEPGEYLVVYASGKNLRQPDEGILHTNFKLNDSGDYVLFSTPDAQTIDSIEVQNMIMDVSYGRDEYGHTWLYYPAPTPGGVNFTKGFENLSGKNLPGSSTLHINEVMARNTNTISDEEGDFEDWIEIHNSGTTAINLKNYGLSDRVDELFQWVFPDVTIEPLGFLLVFASGKDRAPTSILNHTNFRIGAAGETLMLTAPTGERVDELITGALSTGISVGRYPDGASNRLLFKEPTPGTPNSNDALVGYAIKPQASHQSGFYDSPLSVALSTNSWQHSRTVIRYTLDGQEPSAVSPVFTAPIPINTTTVLRARVFVDGLLPSATLKETFFINEATTLSVLSIMMDPRDLWDPVGGIYVLGNNAQEQFPYKGANFWDDVEKPLHFQFFEPDGRLGFRFDAGIKIGGQYSRAMPQKIFNIFARNEYGADVMEYPFFPGKSLTTYKALTLRTSGQDGVLSKMRDTMMTSLLSETDLDCQAYRPAVVFLNGEYWGIYNIRERINEYFIAYNHDVVPDKVDLLQANGDVRAGSSDHYRALVSFVAAKDMRRAENYEYVQTQMDVENYMDYWISQIYFANTDSANIRFWREQSDEGRWRWIAYDLDWCFFSLNDNTLNSVTYPGGTGIGNNLSTTLLVKLLMNEEFKQCFLERFAFHMKYTFATERVISVIDEMAKVLEPEMARHWDRWGGTMGAWYRDVSFLRYFAEQRPAIVLGHIQRKFGLSNEQMKMFQ